MAWSQTVRDPSSAGFGNEAGLGQGSRVQTYPSPVLRPSEGSGIHCWWQIWQLRLDFSNERNWGFRQKLGQESMSWKEKS